jgi:hypothetical protein
LNFQDWKKAFFIYTDKLEVSSGEKVALAAHKNKILESIKNGMNTKRVLDTEESRNIRITPSWLLGFVEGDGSWFVKDLNSKSKYQMIFSISQSTKDLVLMSKIKEYFDNLSGCYEEVAKLPLTSDNRGMLNLVISKNKFISEKLIPYFLALNWYTKKEKDFKDFILIFKLKELGYHYTEEGKELIELLKNQMNNNRLTTSELNHNIDKEELILRINELLSKGSNYEEQSDSTILIKSTDSILRGLKKSISVLDENGNLLYEFDSMEKCGKFFNTSHATIRRRYRDGKPFKHENKVIYFK